MIEGKTPARFPNRPVTRFIPASLVMHTLLIEAALTSTPTLEKELGEYKSKKKQ